MIKITVGVATSMVIIVLVLVTIIAYKQFQSSKQRKQMSELQRKIELQSRNKVHIYSRNELSITKSIGSGQFGKVMKAYVNESVIAVKELHDQSTDQLSNFVNEFVTMTQIATHPNILMVLGLVTENMSNGNLMICMQFCNEGSLKELIERERDRYFDEQTDIDKYAHTINAEVWDKILAGKRKLRCKLATRYVV